MFLLSQGQGLARLDDHLDVDQQRQDKGERASRLCLTLHDLTNLQSETDELM